MLSYVALFYVCMYHVCMYVCIINLYSMGSERNAHNRKVLNFNLETKMNAEIVSKDLTSISKYCCIDDDCQGVIPA